MNRSIARIAGTSAIIALAGCNRPPTDPRTQTPLVAVAIIEATDDAGPRFTGVVRARIESDLGFRVGGKIVARLVDAGQIVRRGQPLMRLDPTDLALGAAAQMSGVAVARARSVQADAELQRLHGLVAAGAVSAQSYDQAKATADSARAQLDAAQAQARVATNAQRYAVLLADADGVVAETSGEPGQVVAAGQTVIKLAHAGAREAAANLPETVRPAIGSMATAVLYGRSGARFPARLRQLSQTADPVTRTYEARYVLDGAGNDAPLGATVTIAMPNATAAEGAVEAPIGAVYDPGSGPGIWRVDRDRVRFQRVRIASLGAETVKIVGVTTGERIVALGADRLREGDRVRTMPLPATARPVADR